jgi:hypothetical protein
MVAQGDGSNWPSFLTHTHTHTQPTSCAITQAAGHNHHHYWKDGKERQKKFFFNVHLPKRWLSLFFMSGPSFFYFLFCCCCCCPQFFFLTSCLHNPTVQNSRLYVMFDIPLTRASRARDSLRKRKKEKNDFNSASNVKWGRWENEEKKK